MPFSWTCGYCGLAVGVSGPTTNRPGGSLFDCPNCAGLTVQSKGKMSPPPRTFPAVEHLPPDVSTAWDEAVNAAGAGAYTAAEIMCRKILMHVAVDKAEAEGNRNFAYYVDQLEAKGFITTGLKPKIDEIRLRGNEATHELPASTDQIADRTLGVTRHLLVSVYELPNS